MPLVATPHPVSLVPRPPSREIRWGRVAVAVAWLACGFHGALVAETGARAPSVPAPPQPIADVLRVLWVDARGNLLDSARLVDQRHYDHRPRPELRSFGELVAHVVDAQYFFCSAARSQPNPNEPNHRPGVVAAESLEATLEDKDEIVAAAERMVAYCDAAFESASDATLGESLEPGIPGRTRIRPLLLGLYHLAGHYGNMTVYLRELGYLPPSSGS